LTEDLEKNVAKHRNKVSGDKIKGGVKQNQASKVKPITTKGPIGKSSR
jgi:hypothetical protein